MAKAKDLTGLQFGRLTVTERAGTSNNGSAIWSCRCVCGNTKKATTAHLKGGFIQSCGCLQEEVRSRNGASTRKHGACSRITPEYSRLYSVWRSMKDRCENPNCHAYSDYGARVISVCEEWHDFIVFKKWAIKNGYDKDAPYGQCTIDRKDNDKGYCPENCRFITMREQTMNRRSNRSKDGRYRKADCRHGST